MVRFPVGSALFSVLLTSLSFSQITNVTASTATPVPGAGHDYIGMLNETVDPATGSVSIRIQTPTPPGRGLSLPFAFAYDSNGDAHIATDGSGILEWVGNTAYLSQGGWSYSVPMISNSEQTASNLGSGHGGTCIYYDDYVFQNESGGRHPLYLALVTDPLICQYQVYVPEQMLNGGDPYFLASLTNTTSPLYIADADGTVYSFPSSGTHKGTSGLANIYSSIASSIEDRNGNVVTVTDLGSEHSGSFSVTDTLGRTVMSTSGFGSSGDSLSISGLESSYAMDWGAIASGPPVAVGATLLYNGQGLCSTDFPNLSGGGSSEINTITLPNKKSYEFSYDTSYGLLTKITYPDGGYIKYVWGLNALSEFDSLEDTNGGRNNCLWHHDTPAVTNRSVSFDGVNIALQQTFKYSTNWSSNSSSWTTKTTTVKTTDNISGLVDTKVYTYSPVAMPPQPNDFQVFAPQVPVEQTVVTKDSTGKTLRTVSKTWLNQYELASVTTALNDSTSVPTSETTYSYGSGAQVTDMKEYDYGSGAPGSLLRETATNYQVFGKIPLFAAAPSIFDRPCQVITYDGSRNRYAETDAYYDNGATGTPCSAAGTPSITGVSSLTNHDETYYSASSKSPRGNATTMVKQCFQGSTTCTSGNPTTAYTYDETGQALSITDPNGNKTSYSYGDSFASTNSSGFSTTAGTPPSGKVTNAYLTQITQPTTSGVAHIEKFSYGYNDGELTESTDQNTQVTEYAYNDSLGRLTESDYPDKGKTTLFYNDAAPSPSVTTTRLMTASTSITTTVVMDGMGHVVQNNLTSDPNCTTGDITAKTYDGKGQVYTVSNPYCTTSDPTYGLTTFTFDALGRTTKLANPDGTYVMNSYAGRAISVQDEGNGQAAPVQRISQVDGLGRLTSVCEVTSSTQLGPGGTPTTCTGQDITATGFLTPYTYDPLGNLLAVSQGSVGQRTFSYDSLSRLLCAANPETGTATCPSPATGSYTAGTTGYVYDANGNLTQRTRPSPNLNPPNPTVTTTYQYDALNRLTQKSYSDTVPTYTNGTPTVMYGYDQSNITMGSQNFNITNSIDRLSWSAPVTQAVYPITMKAFGYDPMGRVAALWQHTPSQGTSDIAIGYNYDLIGDELNFFVGNSIPGSTEFVSTYNEAGRLTSFTTPTYNDAANPANLLTNANYDSFGHLTSATFANGLSQSLAYDNRERPHAMAVGTTCSAGTCSGSTVYSYGVGYTGDSDVLSATDSVNGTWSYSYDGFNRLATSNCTANCPDNSSTQGFSYGYDRYGNRWNQTVTAGTGGQSLLTFTGPGNHIDGYSYDAVGNLLNDTFHNYRYDAENRLISVDNGATTYIYDADGQRVEKNTGGASLDYNYDREGRVYIYNPPNPTTSEVYAAGLHLGTYILNSAGTDTIFYYDHSDWLGTERARINLSGIACEEIVSMPFGDGQTIAGTCGDISPMHFTGKERDTESGLDNFGARYNASTMGRFMSADPLGGSLTNPQSLNKYTYVLNNPLRYTDPTGLYACADDKNGSHCASKQDQAFEKTLAGLRGKDGDVGRAAAAYGAVNEDNGVTVGFKDLSTKGENGTTTSTIGTDANGNLRANSDVTINSKVSGDDYAAAVGHEGSHVADAQDVVKSGLSGGLLEGQPIHAGMNITPYQSEQRAYGVTNAILSMQNQSRKFDCGANACTLGRDSGMPALLPGVIDQIVAHNPVYNQGGQPMSSTNQGPSVVNGVTPNTTVPH